MSWDIELDDQLLQDLYAWLDQIPLSRPKKRIEKDFADGVMVAELIKYYFPGWVDLHNYAAANSTQQKLINWGLLNRKVLYRFGLNVPEPVMRGICLGRSGLVEVFLYNLRTKIDDYLYGMETNPSDPQYRVLHQQAKTSESNAITPRHRQQHSPPPQQQYEENPVKYASMGSKAKPQGGNIPKKATSMQNLSSDMVSRIEYDEKEQECIAKEEQLQILQAKIRRLEHLLHLKDIRVDDLAEKLDQTRGLPGNSGGKSIRQQQTHIPLNGRK
ncbi:unnamed protein product [Rotaria sp. Silwood1]|nr:unnamed protein product [Rotaria sp. Silwood1]CAF0770575.1 unnamed protein product [Rotaria sp. Silwood1]CAF3348393.1 unnamed protein product [Rotaria sp. Silwood1]CAF4645593.1 unnamed protein product [Rotaria sp. Silwood1]